MSYSEIPSLILNMICDIYLRVEKECTRCHKVFRPSTESQDVCAVCLNEEFGAGVAATDFGRESILKEHSEAMRRQRARASRLARAFRSTSAFSMLGLVRCVLAVILFLICVFFFITSDGDKLTFLNQLPYIYQLSISLGCAIISSLLLLPSFSRHKTIVMVTCLLMLALGATMPTIWHFRVPVTTAYVPETGAGSAKGEQALNNGRLIDDKELSFFSDLKKTRPRDVHYCVFMRCDHLKDDTAPGVISYGRMDQSARNLIRSSLSRLMHGAPVEINNSQNGCGVIFTVSCVPGEKQNISSLLNRYGSVYFSDAAEGIYELTLDPDKLAIGEDCDTSKLLDPMHPAFAELNIKALRSLRADVVRASAKRLADANVNRLRADICNRLIETLNTPWETDLDTYNMLIDALVVYAPEGDVRITPLLWNYFQTVIRAHRSVSNDVAIRLAKAAPDKMNEPVLKLWQLNPTAWNEVAGVLVDYIEPYMIEQLEKKDLSVRQLTDCLNYLQPYGTAKSLPFLQPYLGHADRAISRKASNTIDAIKVRIRSAQ